MAKSPQSTAAELEAAVKSSAEAFKTWSQVPILTRQKYMFDLAHIIRRDTEKYAARMTEEHGKTKADAKGDVIRGLEVVEHACGTSHIITGETIENISKGIDCYYYRVPLGVCAGIPAFNFPLMIPLWMFPIAITCGNTFIIKPSERVGGAVDMLTHALKEIDLPKGVVNVVHGGFETTKQLCAHPTVKALSFVGSNKAGEYVYEVGSKHGKRVQSNMGAKNHGIVMPDADKDDALNALCNAAFGASGQRCMALSVAVLVGDANKWIPDLVKKAQSFKIGAGKDDGVDLSPVCYPELKERIVSLISTAEKEGATLALDGRNYKHPQHTKGNFVGPTIITNVNENMTCYKEEIFGPALVVVSKPDLQSAIEFINANAWGNGAAIFTRSGNCARKFQYECEAGQLGINVPIPVTICCYSGATSNVLVHWQQEIVLGRRQLLRKERSSLLHAAEDRDRQMERRRDHKAFDRHANL